MYPFAVRTNSFGHSCNVFGGVAKPLRCGLAFVLVCCAPFFLQSALGAEASERPNIVFILADDLGYGDLGCYGRSDIETPSLDRLASQGVRFTQHYANGPECSPTRTAFMTGRYQQWVGGLECAIGTGNVGRYDDAIRLRQQHQLGLPTDQTTIVRLLRDAGYATAITGKWHLGYEPHFAPHLHGFQHTFYCIGGGMDYFHYIDTVGAYNLFADGKPIERDGYFTDLATDEAIDFIKDHRHESFFLYLPYTCPHSPFQGPEEEFDEPLPLDSPRWNQSKAPPQVYIAMVERMDACIGRVLEALHESGVEERTLVIFAGDNGGTASSRNDPLRGTKGSTFEGGIRVPAMARWPTVIPQGVTSDQVCITFDLTAGMANAAGVALPTDKPFEGMDIIQHVADGKPDVERTLFWRKPRGTTVWAGVRRGDLKYVSKRDGEQRESYLFDLGRDVSETNDLSGQHPEALKQLADSFVDWETRTRRNRRGRP